MRTWLFLPVQSTRLNFALSDATFTRFLNTVMSFGGSVLGLYGNDIAVRYARMRGLRRTVRGMVDVAKSVRNMAY